MSTPIQKIIFGSPGTGKSYKIDSEIIPKLLQIDASKSPENIINRTYAARIQLALNHTVYAVTSDAGHAH
jgi:hypothetical protein